MNSKLMSELIRLDFPASLGCSHAHMRSNNAMPTFSMDIHLVRVDANLKRLDAHEHFICMNDSIYASGKPNRVNLFAAHAANVGCIPSANRQGIPLCK
jgi:hypothetical protein